MTEVEYSDEELHFKKSREIASIDELRDDHVGENNCRENVISKKSNEVESFDEALGESGRNNCNGSYAIKNKMKSTISIDREVIKLKETIPLCQTTGKRMYRLSGRFVPIVKENSTFVTLCDSKL